MKASKFTEAQIALVLRRAKDCAPVSEVCWRAGISDATFYNWRKNYDGAGGPHMAVETRQSCAIIGFADGR